MQLVSKKAVFMAAGVALGLAAATVKVKAATNPTNPFLQVTPEFFDEYLWGYPGTGPCATSGLRVVWVTLAISGGKGPYKVMIRWNDGLTWDSINNPGPSGLEPPGENPANPNREGTYDIGLTYCPAALGPITGGKVTVTDSAGNSATAAIVGPQQRIAPLGWPYQ